MSIETKSAVHYTVGGKEFLTLEEAQQYETLLLKRLKFKYYLVTTSPDLTEGRGYYNKQIIAIHSYGVSNALIQYLVNTYKNPVALVMGVSPMDNWLIEEGKKFDNAEDLDKYLNTEVQIGVGDYRTYKIPDVIYLDDYGKPTEL